MGEDLSAHSALDCFSDSCCWPRWLDSAITGGRDKRTVWPVIYPTLPRAVLRGLSSEILYERGLQEISVTPCFLPLLKKGISGAKSSKRASRLVTYSPPYKGGDLDFLRPPFVQRTHSSARFRYPATRRGSPYRHQVPGRPLALQNGRNSDGSGIPLTNVTAKQFARLISKSHTNQSPN
jgi:hypothetical protein